MQRAKCSMPDHYDVIIAEKPKAANKIAYALGRPTKCIVNRVPLFIISTGHEYPVVVVSSAGHMFGPSTSVEGLPVTTIRWEPIWKFERRSSYLKPYYEVLSRVVPKARYFINACDYDIEGSTIGFKIIETFGDLRRAKRMKFSSLVPSELKEAYRRLLPLDINNAMAGVARAELDWLWGINLSRLLMKAYASAAGSRISLSAGRVQTPTLAEAVRRWIRINSYVPLPVFSLAAQLNAGGRTFTAVPEGWRPSTLAEARLIAREVKVSGKMKVVDFRSTRKVVSPPPPFNLTRLQEEAARIYGMSPFTTQEVAEDLYLAALISYPRTNSEKLPRGLNYVEVVRSIGRQREYSELVTRLLDETKGVLEPHEGKSDDPAHPAIYPTGEQPTRLDSKHRAIYDLIVRRFLATFATPEIVSSTTAVLVDHKSRKWRSEGAQVVDPGWTKYYPFRKERSAELPPLNIGDQVAVSKVSLRTVWEGPGVKLSRLSLLEWMEANDLGTKGTRARIIETLYRRGFLRQQGRATEVTDLGFAVYKALSTLAPELLSVSLTRDFEKLLEDISEGRATRDAVVSKAKEYISGLVSKHMGADLAEIGSMLASFNGKGRPGRRCVICGRPAEEGSQFCELHMMAFNNISKSLGDLTMRLGTTRQEALRRLAENNVAGRWVREVARYLADSEGKSSYVRDS